MAGPPDGPALTCEGTVVVVVGGGATGATAACGAAVMGAGAMRGDEVGDAGSTGAGRDQSSERGVKHCWDFI